MRGSAEEAMEALAGVLQHHMDNIRAQVREGLEKLGEEMVEDARRRAPIRKTQDRRWGTTTKGMTKNQAEVHAELQKQSAAEYEKYAADHPDYKKPFGAAPHPGLARTRRASNTRLSAASRNRVFSTVRKTKKWRTSKVDPQTGMVVRGVRRQKTADFPVFRVGKKGRMSAGAGPHSYGSRARYDIQRGRGMTVSERNKKKLVYGGTLKKSIGYRIVDTEDGFQLILYADAPYAKYVEYGTRFMGAQPFLLPAFKKGEIRVRADTTGVLLGEG